jgi:hypothetical protein
MTVYNRQLPKIKRSREQQKFWDDLDLVWSVIARENSWADVEIELDAFLNVHDRYSISRPKDPDYPEYVVVGLLVALLNLLAKKKAA